MIPTDLQKADKEKGFLPLEGFCQTSGIQMEAQVPASKETFNMENFPNKLYTCGFHHHTAKWLLTTATKVNLLSDDH